MISLSHTAKEKYLRCPLSYYMHYILKWREEKVGSPLVFGSAIDEGQNSLLEGKTLEEALRTFNDKWMYMEINGQKVIGSETDLVKYSKADTKEGLAETGWESLKIKGEMLIKSYQEEIMPQIKNVLAVQEPISIKNYHGDLIRGFADIIIELQDGRIALIDNKTSANPYRKDAVTVGDKAKQLALYYEALKDKFKLDVAGFYVSEKKIRVRDPQTRIQVLIDKVPENIIQETFDEFENVLYNIRMGNFPSNHPNCNMFYGDCICGKYLASNGEDTSGLINVKKEYK